MKNKTVKRVTESTYTDSAAVLTSADLVRAVEAIKEASKQPFITGISSKHEWWKLLRIDNTSHNFSLYGGIPCVQDDKVPSNIARFHYSDGTYDDKEISPLPSFLSPDYQIKAPRGRTK